MTEKTTPRPATVDTQTGRCQNGEANAHELDPLEAEHFTFLCADNTPYLDGCFRLRYEVYCLNRGFLDSGDYPDGRELDEFDPHSIHFACVARLTDEVVGTIRLVARSELGYPLSSHCDVDYSALPPETYEISRLAVSKQYRRRADDDAFGVPHSAFEDASLRTFNRRRRPEIVLGLYKAMYQESKRRGITAWIAAMEHSLSRLLGRLSFEFHPIGPEVDYYGPVTPYVAYISEIETAVRSQRPEIYDEFTHEMRSALKVD